MDRAGDGAAGQGLRLADYLKRLGVAALPIGRRGLAILQEAHIRALPFENIDTFLGREPPWDVARTAVKMLGRGRGGWCFEQNALYGAALDALGFRAERRLARVRNGQPSGGPRLHLALVCDIGGERFLADAGFGGAAPLAPLRLDSDAEQVVPNGIYALSTDPATGERVVSRIENGETFALYGVDEAHVTDADITGASFICANWSGSPFPSHLMVNGHSDGVRIGLFDRTATFESGGRRLRSEVGDAASLRDLLCGRLGLALDADTVGAVWDRIADTPPSPRP